MSSVTVRRLAYVAAPACIAAYELNRDRPAIDDRLINTEGPCANSALQSRDYEIGVKPLSERQENEHSPVPNFVRLQSPGLLDIASVCLSKFKANPEASRDARQDTAAKEHADSEQAQPHPDVRESDANDEPLTRSRAASILPSWLHCEKYAELAAQYSTDLDRVREILQSRGVHLPAYRFKENNAELMRFAFTMGLIEAQTAKEREDAVLGTVGRIEDAMQWLSQHSFSTDAELKQFDSLLYWEGTSESGHPVLVIKIGQATRECKGEALMVYAGAIISQVQKAVESKFSDEAGLPEQLVVIADCQGTSPLQGKRLLKAIKQIGLVLNKHYPGRLHRFYVVDLPRVLKWPVKAAIIAVGHPLTRQKVLLCTRDDPALEGAL